MKRLELLQSRLYQKAKREPERRFHSLHDKICRLDVLQDAWKSVRENHGSAGIDGQTIEDIEAFGADRVLTGVREELTQGTYRASPVKRVFIPKPDGTRRPLGIPTVRDRIVQQAVKSVIEPIFEADFKACSYGYRPNRSAKDASEEIRKYLNYGYTNVIDIDVKGFFDHIDHEKMLFFISKRIADPYILKLIREWLRSGISLEGEITYPEAGTPQGGVISPLLANIYLNQMDTLWVKRRMDYRYGQNARMIRYADDIVILTDRDPEYAMHMAERILSILSLELNPEKSRITTGKEGFDFLGFHFVREPSKLTGKESTYVYPGAKSVRKFRENIRSIVPRNVAFRKPMSTAVRQVNAVITGWRNYYSHTNATATFAKLQKFVEWKLAKYYCFIHKIDRVSRKAGIREKVREHGLVTLRGRMEYSRNA